MDLEDTLEHCMFTTYSVQLELRMALSRKATFPDVRLRQAANALRELAVDVEQVSRMLPTKQEDNT